MPQRSIDPAAVEAEIERIRSLGLDALRHRWRSMFSGAPPEGLSKNIIARMIAYRMQEEVFGGLDREARGLLERLARGEKPRDLNRRLKPGTVLVREYRGERHTVTVMPDGFLWQGTTYSSLSTIARAITGTAWNGPRFFGLRTNGRSAEIGELCGLVTAASAKNRRRRSTRTNTGKTRKEVRT